MASFSIPLSGLTAESTALSAIANNLSNQNTTGYKDTSVLFSDLFYQTLGTTGAGDPIQVGAGTEVGSMPSLFTQGSISSTGVPTDVAIQGSGFFAVQDSSGVIDYTRAGDFSVDANNYLVTADGQQVLGYPAVNGVVNTGNGIVPLQLGAGILSPPSATGNVELTANLDASSTAGDTFSTPITIYDSLGASHTLTATFTNTGANTWGYSLSIPSTDLNPITSGTPPVIQSAERNSRYRHSHIQRQRRAGWGHGNHRRHGNRAALRHHRHTHHRLCRWRFQSNLQLERAERNQPGADTGRGHQHDFRDPAGWQQQWISGELHHRIRRHHYWLLQQRQDAGFGRVSSGQFRQRQRTSAQRQYGLHSDSGFRPGGSRCARCGRTRNDFRWLSGIVERRHRHRIRQPDRSPTRL